MLQTYRDVRDQQQEALRRSVVLAAEQLLVSEGAQAVTVRRVAQQLGCSTTVLYNLFGSKDGLGNALYLEGCRLLHERLAEVAPADEPLRYLTALAWAYWDFAQQHRPYYTLMFSGALPEFKPDPASVQQVGTAIGLVVGTLEEFRARGALADADATATATMLWAALHGVVHLFFAGHLGDISAARAVYERTATTLLGALLA